MQSEASLYAAAGDTARAVDYMNRVQAHYAQTKTVPPANIEIQNAWLLYNTRNDRALYRTLMHLGGRQDLTVAQRETVQTIWASWSVRRAGAAIDNNDNQRAVDILEAATLAFPDNAQVKKVLAGGYLRTGQTREALAIYKSVGMLDASAADFQGAIGAALAANDKTQAEAWLRQALERFPNDAGILGMAARFEQARGDNQRAADYWRASLAAMPAASSTDKLAHIMAYPDVSGKTHKATSAADLQQLLNPDYEPFAKTTKLPPLPSYGPDPYNGRAPVVMGQPQPAVQYSPSIAVPTTTDVPVTGAPASRSTTIPVPVPQARAPDATQPLSQPANQTATSTAPGHARTSSKSTSPSTSSKHSSSASTPYSGKMNLPPSEENITSTDSSLPEQPQTNRSSPVFIPVPEPSTAPVAPSEPVYIPPPQSSVTSPDGNAQPSMRITSQPIDSKAAEAQARFAEQTDPQLTQGSAGQIHTLANAPVSLPSNPVHPALGQAPPGNTEYSATQYTPSAQEAATGAYSAPKQQTTTTPPPAPQPAPAAQPPTSSMTTPAPQKKTKHQAQPTQTVPTLVTAPGEQSPTTQCTRRRARLPRARRLPRALRAYPMTSSSSGIFRHCAGPGSKCSASRT